MAASTLVVGCFDGNGVSDRSVASESGDGVALREAEQSVVYGEDDRMDYYAHPDQNLRAITEQAIVAMVSANGLSEQGDNLRVSSSTLGDQYGLCSDERFADHPTIASCSGTLIDDDLVLTAGHCVQNGCGRSLWLFNYLYESEGDLRDLSYADLFECEQVVVSSVPGWTGGADYAIFQLDRPATPRFEPVAVHPGEWPVSDGDPLAIIGFGSGVPAKIDDGGFVIDDQRGDSAFSGTTDSFGGNSGSGVFDDDNRVVGILVAGEQDYVRDGSCTRAATRSADGQGGGETITYAFLAVQELCEDGWPSERLCGTEAVCGDGLCSGSENFSSCPDDCEAGVAPGWTCDPEYYAAGDGCDCECGAYDPDCDDASQELLNCDDEQVCGQDGSCQDVSGVPDAWSCELEYYAAGDGCDCDCGAYDPDCDDDTQDLYNCPPGAVCNASGMCETDGNVVTPTDPDAGLGADVGGGDDAGLGGFGDLFPGVGGGNGGCASTPSPRAPFGLGALLVLAATAARRRSL